MSEPGSLPPASSEPSRSGVLLPSSLPALLTGHQTCSGRSSLLGWAGPTSPVRGAKANHRIPWHAIRVHAARHGPHTRPGDCCERSATGSGLQFHPKWGYVDTPVPVTGNTKQVYLCASQLKSSPTSHKGGALFWWPVLPARPCRAFLYHLCDCHDGLLPDAPASRFLALRQ